MLPYDALNGAWLEAEAHCKSTQTPISCQSSDSPDALCWSRCGSAWRLNIEGVPVLERPTEDRINAAVKLDALLQKMEEARAKLGPRMLAAITQIQMAIDGGDDAGD